ncbi:hypothetical protein M427DRAFT_132944 [Gonapodya prolifera JEL478]|uniref:SMP-LTD domain-containing protein n=1 Tax=Gonapodya prolifera (strain JEL478) TaxID=1344416 RepID=A0A139AN55_GONPJ|nr:hypothetical protein M427DRAFT_132944 [Gonapodya prolifera JEL478]|eukprot:KXS18182.1 hypothetical protein M427DRAFT_132944 [Gonapodya prolifera JEL478]
MAFRFNWPRFDQRFVDHASEQLERALNREGEGRPSKIAGRIEVKEMDLGTKPPELEMLEIGELTDEKFRGIFKLTYNGDAYLILQTQVQANPLQPPKPTHPRTLRPRTAPLAASSPLLVPMTIRISCLRLRGIAALVVDRHKGVTLSFKTDPLDSVQVSSSFDGVDNVRRFLQATIENQLRKLFADDLPNLIHGISLQMMSQMPAGVAYMCLPLRRLRRPRPTTPTVRPPLDTGTQRLPQ